MELMLVLIPLVAGYVLDLLLGDPRRLPHPVVLFGNLIGWIERKWNKGRCRFLKGGVVAVVYPLGVLAAGWGVAWCAQAVGVWCSVLVATVFVFYGLANRSLIQEGGEVIRALREQGLEAGRKRLSWIVGRDTSELTPKEIYTAVLETMAENLSDGVIAPLFWYLVLGLPGMLAYKMVNTLDSMIGYKNERYRDFGCFAAHADDVANYLPARLAALLMVVASGRLSLVNFVRKYGNKHASPNSGFPESALAGILDCRFGGPHDYFGETVYKPFIGEHERTLTTADMRLAIRINRRAEGMMIAFMVAVYAVLRLGFGQ